MEANLRIFLSDAFLVEKDRSDSESVDVFTHLEIKSLLLLRRIKKLNKANCLDDDNEGNDKDLEVKISKNLKKVTVKFINPKKQIPKKAYKCPHCEFTSASLNVKSLQNHIKDLHPNLAQVSENDFVIDGEEARTTKIECLLRKRNGQKCGQFFTSDQLNRHLRAKKLHDKVPDFPKSKEFKGWRIIDDEVEMVCDLPSAEDPPSEEEMDIEEKTENKTEAFSGQGKKRKASVNVLQDAEASKKKATSNDKVLEVKDGLDIPGDCGVSSYLPIQTERSLESQNSQAVVMGENLSASLEGVSFQLVPDPNSSAVTIINISDQVINDDRYSAGSKTIKDTFLSSSAIESIEASQLLTVDHVNVDFPFQSETDEIQNQPPDVDLLNSFDPNLVLENLEKEENNNISEALQIDSLDHPDDDSAWIPNNTDYGLNLVLTSQESVTREDLETPNFVEVTDKVDPRKTVTVTSFNPEVGGDSFWIKDKSSAIDDEKIVDEQENKEDDNDSSDSDLEVDEDYDENLDSTPGITRLRQERKKVRLSQRDCAEKDKDLTEIPENKVFITDFMRWLKEKTGLKTSNKSCSTFDFSMGHGFEYVDCYLNFMTSKNPEFTLSRLVAFKDKSKFLAIESPVLWISTAAGADKTSNPLRQKEQLKLHKRLREYILYVMNQTTFDGNEVLQTLVVNQRLQAIDHELDSLKIYKKCTDLYEKEKAKTKRMKMIINPSGNQLEYSSVRKWFTSEDSKQLEAEVREICKEALESKTIKAVNFNKVANTVRFTLAILDKNRPSSYKFKQMDYMSKRPIWLPDGDKYLWSLDSLPDDWNMFRNPDPDDNNVPPTCFVITLDGSQPEIKMQAETTIIMNMKTFELMELYRDIRKMVLGELPSHSTFFLNHRGKELSRLQNYKGSLVARFGAVVGIPDFKMTQIRKALEGKIQGSDQADYTKAINNHSKAVVATYDNAKSMRRTVFMASMSAAETSEEADKESVKNHYNLRKKKDQSEQNQMKNEATQYLDQKKKKGKRILNLAPDPITKPDALFLKGLFTTEDVRSKI